jgi:hypothetical protein
MFAHVSFCSIVAIELNVLFLPDVLFELLGSSKKTFSRSGTFLCVKMETISLQAYGIGKLNGVNLMLSGLCNRRKALCSGKAMPPKGAMMQAKDPLPIFFKQNTLYR